MKLSARMRSSVPMPPGMATPEMAVRFLTANRPEDVLPTVLAHAPPPAEAAVSEKFWEVMMGRGNAIGSPALRGQPLAAQEAAAGVSEKFW